MIELQGKYNTAKVFTDDIDNAAISQVISMLNEPGMEGSTIRIMPDVHAGKGCTIGTTMTLHDKVVPSLVGVDIGCGMLTIKLKEKSINYKELDKCILKNVPSGMNVRTTAHEYLKNTHIDDLLCKDSLNMDRVIKSVGTLGGGNHFIEIDKSVNDELYLVIHTGSRYLGKQIAEYYQDKAEKQIRNNDVDRKNERQSIINTLKSQGKADEISEALKELNKEGNINFPYCEGDLFNAYIHDMKIAQEYAYWNRMAIANEITKGMSLTIDNIFETIHNYIDMDSMILRKGAISCRNGEQVLIPMNMRDGSLLCIGKGNPDWNYSGPHGAGRILSRSQAKDMINIEDFTDTMSGIYTSSIGRSTLDESPFAYKPIDEIKENIKDTVEIIDTISPTYNFKACDERERMERIAGMEKDDIELDL